MGIFSEVSSKVNVENLQKILLKYEGMYRTTLYQEILEYYISECSEAYIKPNELLLKYKESVK